MVNTEVGGKQVELILPTDMINLADPSSDKCKLHTPETGYPVCVFVSLYLSRGLKVMSLQIPDQQISPETGQQEQGMQSMML